MKRRYIIGIILTVLFLFIASGCSPKIDATNNETFKASLEKVRQSLPESERTKLDDAIKYQAAMYAKDNVGTLIAVGAAALLTNGNNDTVNDVADIKAREFLMMFDGKTGKEIIKEYEAQKDKPLF